MLPIPAVRNISHLRKAVLRFGGSSAIVMLIAASTIQFTIFCTNMPVNKSARIYLLCREINRLRQLHRFLLAESSRLEMRSGLPAAQLGPVVL
jgi:hypothetical protein